MYKDARGGLSGHVEGRGGAMCCSYEGVSLTGRIYIKTRPGGVMGPIERGDFEAGVIIRERGRLREREVVDSRGRGRERVGLEHFIYLRQKVPRERVHHHGELAALSPCRPFRETTQTVWWV